MYVGGLQMVPFFTGFTAVTETLFLGRTLDAVLASSDPTDLCRQIVHAPLEDWPIRGCVLYFVDNKSTIKLIASYGQVLDEIPGLSAWDDSPLSESVREQAVRFANAILDGNTVSIMAVPLIANGSPRGVVGLILDQPDFKVDIPDVFFQTVSKLGALYLDTLDYGRISLTESHAQAHPDDITARQLIILGHIQSGLVNGLIAKVLMLSESTIRQETVKIYRSLGVGDRIEAVKKAKVLGLLPKRVALQG
jgi:DNA-binding CsgD family transcriptional regulator